MNNLFSTTLTCLSSWSVDPTAGEPTLATDGGLSTKHDNKDARGCTRVIFAHGRALRFWDRQLRAVVTRNETKREKQAAHNTS